MNALRAILLVVDRFALGFFLVAGCAQLVLIASASRRVRHRMQRELLPVGLDPQRSAICPRVTALVPAHDEGAVIANTVQSLLTMEYPNLEIVVINDGSTDDTLRTLVDAFALRPVERLVATQASATVKRIYASAEFPDLLVIDADNGGKANALNIGLGLATGELVCAIDADTLIDPRAIGQLVQPFLDDPSVIAAGGTIRPANGCTVRNSRVVDDRTPRGLLASIQDVEYVRAFVHGRLGWNRLGGNIIISGAFGLFRATALRNAGGFSSDTVGEDMEIVLRMRRQARMRHEAAQVWFVPDPIAWTEVPETLRSLGHQRDRWQRGLLDSLRMHRDMFFRPRYGAMGMVVMPYFAIFELASPIVEALGIVAITLGIVTGAVGWGQAFAFLLVAYGLSFIAALWAMLLDAWVEPSRVRSSDAGRRLRAMVLEQCGYRQLTVYWRLRGLAKALRGDQRWGTQHRQGYTELAPSAPAPAPAR